MPVARWERQLTAKGRFSPLYVAPLREMRHALWRTSRGADTRTRRPVLRRGRIGFRAKIAKGLLCGLGVLCARNSSESSREISRRVSGEEKRGDPNQPYSLVALLR